MANEVLFTGSLVYDDSESAAVALQTPDTFATVTTKLYARDKIVVGTSERAIPLSDVTSLGWAVFKNVGAAGTIYLRVASAGAKFAALAPGEFWQGPLGPDAQVPYAIASVAGCKLDYLVCST